MTELLRYSPTPVTLPIDGSLSRRFYNTRSHLDDKPQLTDKDYAGFETHALFHDVFLDANGGRLNAIGPPLVNLANDLLPLETIVWVSSGGGTGSSDMKMSGGTEQRHRVKHRIKNHDRVTFHYFDLPEALRDIEGVHVEFRFANGYNVSVGARRQRLNPVELQFVTLQKNNPASWIIDWLNWCHELGVQRVILYDNGSDNVAELEAALSEFSVPLDIVLVHWPYAYGPLRSYYNQFCQATQNNHVYQCFGQASWTGHFDVDEYLVLHGKESLCQLLSRQQPNIGLLRFDSYWMPNTGGIDAKVLPTVRNFPVRERTSRGRAHKYIARSTSLRMANTHNAKVKLLHRRKQVRPADAAFLHYKALTTQWRDYAMRGQAEEFDATVHIEDRSVIDALSENLSKPLSRSATVQTSTS